MTVQYNFEPLYDDFPPRKLVELKKQIENSIPFLEKNIDRLLDYLKKENKLENYIEINLPFLDSNISYKISLFYGKIIVSIMRYDDSVIFGHLLLDGYECLGKEEIQKLGGTWKEHTGKQRFKEIW